MAFAIPESVLAMEQDISVRFPGIKSFKGNRSFYCWWRLIDDTIWNGLYEQTGVLDGKLKDKYKGVTNCILTNLYKSGGQPVVHLRHQDNYKPGTFYSNEGMSYRIMKNCIDKLYESGLIEFGVGDSAAYTYSYFQETEKLQDVFKEFSIENSNICYVLTRTVFLREAKTKQIETVNGFVEVPTDGAYLPVDYAKKPAKPINNLLKKYNNFIQGFDISWEATKEARLLHKCKVGRSEPNFSNRSLHCIFNVNMSKGGRMYGAFWINMPKILRPYLRIQGEPLTDIDFNACHIVLLYRDIKETAPENPYLYGREDDRRDIAKKLLLTMLNYKVKKKSQSDAQSRRGVIYASEVQKEYPVEYEDVKAILLELEGLHAPIKKSFYTGIGLTLQCKEANIMQKIMKACMKDGIPILPCHDGCSVRVSDAIRVKEIFKAVTDLPCSRDELKENNTKVRDKLEAWFKTEPATEKVNTLKDEFTKIKKKTLEGTIAEEALPSPPLRGGWEKKVT